MHTDQLILCTDADPVLSRLIGRPGPAFALVWVPFLLLGPVVDAILSADLGRLGALILLGVVFTVAVVLPYRRWGRPAWRSEVAFAVFTAMVIGYEVGWRVDEQFLYPLLAICAAAALRRRWAMGMVGAAAVSGGIAGGIAHASLDTGLLLAFTTFIAGAATFVVQYLVEVVAELRATRQQLADSAVTAERLRFSRDLHDLLGHTLSVIVVKAEAPRRLIGSDPQAASAHAADIETIGRRALTDVRDAVTGYRTVRLLDELDSARTALGAAGIDLVSAVPPDPLPDAVDTVLGWIVREGTTNVLRHSGAACCRVTVTVEHGRVRIEIRDDGHGSAAAPGDGLTGLRERLRPHDGELSALATGDGFTLTAVLADSAMARRAG